MSKTASSSLRGMAVYLLKIAILAVAYHLAARLGLKMAYVQFNTSPVWPPTGIALAALLIFGYKVWPGISLGVLLLDFILGYNASMDPVGELIDSILEARQTMEQRGGSLTVIASLCATDGDPQDTNLQARYLEDAGALVFRSSARAVAFCRELLL